MIQTGSLIWLLAGASLLSIVARVAIPPFAWLAMTFLIHAFRPMPAMAGLAAVWAGIYAALAFALRGSIPVSGAAYFAIVAANTTSLTLPFALDRFVASRLGGVRSTLVFPMALVTVEFLRSRFVPGATWGSIAYTQYGYLVLMQLAAFIGMWGITFLIGWFASTFSLAWSYGFDWRIVRKPVLIYAGVLAAVLTGGSVRLALAPSDRAAIRVAAVNRPVDLFMPGEMTRITEGRVPSGERRPLLNKLARLQDWFLDGSRREARAGARLIVWPEQNLLIPSDDEAGFLERARRLALDERVYLAMGMGTIHRGERLPFENKLVLIDPSGRIIVSYRKTHPVFGWEEGIMRRGDGRLPVVATSDGRIAGAICYDADFPEFIRQAGQASADILIIPANDWKEIKTVHAQMAAFRAIENGVPVVRHASSGTSSAFDAWGRLLGAADYFSPGDRTFTAQVPMGSVPTLYARIGDLFAWFCVAGLVVALAVACVSNWSRSRQNYGFPKLECKCAVYFLLSGLAFVVALIGAQLLVRSADRVLIESMEQQLVRAAQIGDAQVFARERD